MKMTLGDVAGAINASEENADPGVVIAGVSTDTRRIKEGELFFALKGDNFDGHAFVNEAFNKGASCAVVSRLIEEAKGPLLLVGDTLWALQELAAYHRRLFSLPVIGVTGSVGKTSTKDMIAAVLGERWPVLKTMANFNNEIGLPLTLLSLEPQHRVLVVEMAMRAPGEIDLLSRIARPTLAVITSVGESHLELLGSRENIARAKGEILEHIPAEGVAFLNADSPFLRKEAGRCRGRVVYYGQAWDADLRLTGYRPANGGSQFTVSSGNDENSYFIPAYGLHNAVNALAAIGLARELGLSEEEIQRGLMQSKLSPMRMEVSGIGSCTVINDAYNASPTSVKAALSALKDLAGERRAVAVLGDMLELGVLKKDLHREVGMEAARQKIDLLVCVGDLAVEISKGAKTCGFPADKIFTVSDAKECAALLARLLGPRDVVLIKGSRGMRMEEIFHALKEGLDT